MSSFINKITTSLSNLTASSSKILMNDLKKGKSISEEIKTRYCTKNGKIKVDRLIKDLTEAIQFKDQYKLRKFDFASLSEFSLSRKEENEICRLALQIILDKNSDETIGSIRSHAQVQFDSIIADIKAHEWWLEKHPAFETALWFYNSSSKTMPNPQSIETVVNELFADPAFSPSPGNLQKLIDLGRQTEWSLRFLHQIQPSGRTSQIINDVGLLFSKVTRGMALAETIHQFIWNFNRVKVIKAVIPELDILDEELLIAKFLKNIELTNDRTPEFIHQMALFFKDFKNHPIKAIRAVPPNQRQDFIQKLLPALVTPEYHLENDDDGVREFLRILREIPQEEQDEVIELAYEITKNSKAKICTRDAKEIINSILDIQKKERRNIIRELMPILQNLSSFDELRKIFIAFALPQSERTQLLPTIKNLTEIRNVIDILQSEFAKRYGISVDEFDRLGEARADLFEKAIPAWEGLDAEQKIQLLNAIKDTPEAERTPELIKRYAYFSKRFYSPSLVRLRATILKIPMDVLEIPSLQGLLTFRGVNEPPVFKMLKTIPKESRKALLVPLLEIILYFARKEYKHIIMMSLMLLGCDEIEKIETGWKYVEDASLGNVVAYFYGFNDIRTKSLDHLKSYLVSDLPKEIKWQLGEEIIRLKEVMNLEDGHSILELAIDCLNETYPVFRQFLSQIRRIIVLDAIKNTKENERSLELVCRYATLSEHFLEGAIMAKVSKTLLKIPLTVFTPELVKVAFGKLPCFVHLRVLQMLLLAPNELRMELIQPFMEMLGYTNERIVDWMRLLGTEKLREIVDVSTNGTHINVSVLYLHQGIREASYQQARETLESDLPPQDKLRLARLIIDNSNAMLLHEEHDLLQLAISTISICDEQALKNPKNPYCVFGNHKKAVESEAMLDISLPSVVVAGKIVRWNLQKLREKGVWTGYTLKDLPDGVNANTIVEIVNNLEKRMNPDILQYIVDSCEASFERLKSNLIELPFLNGLLKREGKADDPISPTQFQLFAILRAMLDLDANVADKEKLSPREDMLLKMAASVQNCSTGQRDGLANFYNALPEKYKRGPQAQEGPAAKAEKFVDACVQKALNATFYNESLAKELLQVSDSDSIKQMAHVTEYLKNRFHKQVGFQHRISFDKHTGVLPEGLLDLKTEFVLRHFFLCFVPSIVVRQIISDSSEALKDTLFVGMQALIKGDIDYQALCEFDENLFPQRLTQTGALALLQAAGYVVDASTEGAYPCG